MAQEIARPRRTDLIREQIIRRCKLLKKRRAAIQELLISFDRADARRQDHIADQIGDAANWQ